MGILYISSKNKNPLIKFEQKQTEKKNPRKKKKTIVRKLWGNAWKLKVNEKERVFRSYLHLRTKTLEDLRRKRQKTFLDWIGRERKGQKEKKYFW